MLDDCQQFKAAFLARCHEAGVADEDVLGLVKAATAAIRTERVKAGKWQDWIPGLPSLPSMNTASKLLLGYPLTAAVAGGAGIGYGLAKLPSLSDVDPKEVTDQERIDAYRRTAKRMELQTRLKQLQQSTRPSYSRM